MPTYDAVLIPGGGVKNGGELPPWVINRLDRAIEHDAGLYIALSAGTFHKPPPLTPDGRPIYESVAAAEYLIARGIAPACIRTETSSWDTIGNAFFSRVIHVDPLALRRLLILTSDFHMTRTEAIFRWVYSLSSPRPAYELSFEATPDEGMDEQVLHARRNKEQIAIQQFSETQKSIQALPELHHWLFTQHAAYAVGAPPNPADAVSGAILNSY
jgi:uncharacterized SAM-binding protein YcdF (DUF218 family)